MKREHKGYYGNVEWFDNESNGRRTELFELRDLDWVKEQSQIARFYEQFGEAEALGYLPENNNKEGKNGKI